jgi:hypothetical protein
MVGKTAVAREKSRALGNDLKSMFRSLEKRPVPPRLQSVVDQLAAQEPVAAAKKAG